MKKMLLCFSLIFILSPETKAEPANEEHFKNLSIIHYGIESQIIELLGRLKNLQEKLYNDDLLELLDDSRSITLKTALLDFFRDSDVAEAIPYAVEYLEDRFELAKNLIDSSFTYLIKIKATEASSIAMEILENKETAWLSQTIRLIAAVGKLEAVPQLVDIYNDPASSSMLKEQILLALSELKADESFELYSNLLEQESSSRIEKMYSVTGLGKLGDPRAISILQNAAFSDIPEVRARAVSALAEFDNDEVRKVVLEAMKDSHIAPRLAAIQAADKLRLEEAVPYLNFKLQYDPERTAREAAIKALASIGTDECFELLIKFLRETGNTAVYRSQVFGAIAANDDNFNEELETMLLGAMNDKDRAFFILLAQAIVLIDTPQAVPFLKVLLTDQDHTIRLGALVAIERHEFIELLETVRTISSNDSAETVSKKAEQVLERLQRASN